MAAVIQVLVQLRDFGGGSQAAYRDGGIRYSAGFVPVGSWRFGRFTTSLLHKYSGSRPAVAGILMSCTTIGYAGRNHQGFIASAKACQRATLPESARKTQLKRVF